MRTFTWPQSQPPCQTQISTSKYSFEDGSYEQISNDLEITSELHLIIVVLDSQFGDNT